MVNIDVIKSGLTATNNLNSNSTGNTNIKASSLSAGGDINIVSSGEVALLTDKNTDQSSYKKEYESTMFFSNQNRGSYDEEVIHSEINSDAGLVTIAGTDGVRVQYLDDGMDKTLSESLTEISSTQENMDYMSDLVGASNVTFEGVT